MELEERRPFGNLRLRIPPRTIDAAIVLVFGVGATLGSLLAQAPGGRDDLRWLALVLSLASSVPLWWRRSRPALVLLLTWAATLPYLVLDLPENIVPLNVYVATYSVAAHGNRRESLIGGVASTVLIAVISILGVLTDEPHLEWPNVIASTVLLAIVWLIGENVHVRRLRTAELQERARSLERLAELEAAGAVADERGRIARELHDVVAHAVSTIVVQASGARRVLDAEPAQAARALEVIESIGRDALGELRRVLGVLRSDGDGDRELEPQPGLARLDDLVEAVRQAGPRVDVETHGTPFALPAAVDLNAFRIVQEALTNVVKHAGESSAHVIIRYTPEWLAIDVTDDGRGAAAELRDGGGGHGITGMRERATLLGGSLVARPRPGGGYEVHARLPIGEQA